MYISNRYCWLLATSQQYLFAKCLLVYVQSWTPDDGRKNLPKHVDCHSKIKYIWDIAASSWFYYRNLLSCTALWTSKKYVPFLPLSVLIELNVLYFRKYTVTTFKKAIRKLNAWFIVLEKSFIWSRNPLTFRVSEAQICIHTGPSLALTWASTHYHQFSIYDTFLCTLVFSKWLLISDFPSVKKVKQSRYRPGVAQRFPGS